MTFPVGPFRRVPLGGGGVKLPSFFPTTLANLEEYYDARTPALTVAHGGNVTPWADLSGHSRDATTFAPDNPPTLLKTSSLSPKGLPLVRFNGTDQSLAFGPINPMPNPNTRGYTFHCYGNWINQVAAGIPWQDGTGLRPQLITNVQAGTMSFRDTAATQSQAGVSSGFHLFSWVFALPGTCTYYLDGVALGTDPWTITYANPSSTILGCNQANNAHLRLDYGYLTWYSDAHSAATVSLFRLWTQIFWGF